MKILTALTTALLLVACADVDTAPLPELDSHAVFAPPFVTYEAEAGTTTGSVVGPSTTYHTVESEASGRKYVHLSATGQYVQWTTTASANGLNLRYNMPDAAAGGGTTGTLSLYVNGTKVQTVNLSSKFAWVYGDTVANPVWYSNNPSAGSPHRFFDQTHVKLATTIAAGATVKLQKDAGDTAAYYNLDLIDLESVPAALAQPAGSQSITSFGAVANDGNDDTAAFNSAVTAAGNGGTVWIPSGTFTFNTRPNAFPSNVTIRGAGMWYSVLDGVGVSFTPNGKTIKFYDLALSGATTLRDDSQLQAGIDGGGNGFGAGSVVQNVWFYHLKVGIWTGPTTPGLAVSNSRVWDTFADGINFYDGTSNSSVTNTSVRNTGDDGIAIWSGGGNACTNNTISGNRVQFPSHANGIAVYGGSGNTVQDNTVDDTVQYGSGIYLANRFGEVPFSGTTTVTGNTLTRTGSFDPDYGYGDGGIRLEANDANMTGTYTLTNNTVASPTYAGVLFVGNGSISGVTFTNLTVTAPGTSGLETRSNARGSATVTSSSYGTVNNAAGANFTISTTGGGGGGGQPDLVVTGVTWSPTSPSAGGGVTFTATIKNQGTAATPASVKHGVAFAVDGTEVTWSDTDFNALAAGATITLTANGGTAGSTWVATAGTHAIAATIDDQNLIAESNETNNTFTTSLTVTSSGGGGGFPAPGTWYKIISRSSGRALEIGGQSSNDGAGADQWDYLSQSNQKWQFIATDSGYYEVIVQNSNKALDVDAASTADHAKVQQWTYGGGTNQQWAVTDVGGGYYKIVARHSGKVLDVAGAATGNGVQVYQNTYAAGTNQQWTIVTAN